MDTIPDQFKRNVEFARGLVEILRGAGYEDYEIAAMATVMLDTLACSFENPEEKMRQYLTELLEFYTMVR